MADKIEKARREGMSYALRIAKEKGIEELEKDLRLRGAIDLPLTSSKTTFEKCVTQLKSEMLQYILVLGAATLVDEFGFGQKRLIRFIERANFKADCINDDYVSFKDYMDEMREKYDIRFKV